MADRLSQREMMEWALEAHEIIANEGTAARQAYHGHHPRYSGIPAEFSKVQEISAGVLAEARRQGFR